MSLQVSPIPVGYEAAIPMLALHNAAEAIEFYRKAFGATELSCLRETNGKIAHAELQINSAKIMLADEYSGDNVSPKSLQGSTVIIHLYVEDADAVVAQALAAGATLLRPVTDQFYGDRSGNIQDPFGHRWIIASHWEDLSMDEIEQRFQTLEGM